ncbi:MAG TPA: nucleotidyltransferase domain-containing protein [Caulobacteraceae bacterium]|nr:nucleotidyltransferase domain-containing protein [Caulobacteraceae bacterium]
MVETPTIDLKSDHRRIVGEILEAFAPDCAVWACGSRARGGARRYSDLDLVLIASAPLPLGRLGDLREAFSESDLPFRVDLVEWSAASPSFRARLARDMVIVRAPPPAT